MSPHKAQRLIAALVSTLLITTLNPIAWSAKPPKAKSTAGRENGAVNTILNGRGLPKAILGVDGDFYIDVTTFMIYGPKKNGKWPTGVSLKGPQGSDGKVGEKGTSGAVGAGTKGDRGEKGDKGDKGDRGEKGERGATGASGESGPQGAAGAMGATGATGPAGPSGPAGAQGAAGPAGAEGPAGATGLQGVQGEKGDKGEKGDQGVPGQTGAKGDTGDVGPIGPSTVYTGSITFSSPLQGAKGHPVTSDTFGALIGNKSYQVDLVIIGDATTGMPSVLPLSFEILTVGVGRSITNVQWTNASVQSFRNGSSVAYEHTVQARFAVAAVGSTGVTNLQVLLKGGVSTSSDPIALHGQYRMQLVGEVTGNG